MRSARSSMGITVLLALVLTGWPAAAGPDVSGLAWLAGCWRNDEGPRVTEECWLAPGGGMMLGVNRTAQGEKGSFEFLRIALDGERLAYFASPGGKPPTPFHLVELDGERVVFENPAHDFPQRILYWIDEDGRLHGRIEGTEDGETRGFEWHWERARSPW